MNDENAKAPRLLSIAAAAKRLRITRSQLQAMIKNGLLGSVRIRDERFVDLETLEHLESEVVPLPLEAPRSPAPRISYIVDRNGWLVALTHVRDHGE